MAQESPDRSKVRTKALHLTSILAVGFALCLSQHAFAEPASAPNGPQSKHVLVIGIDGVRSDALQAANTPVIDGLIATGAVSWDAHAGGSGQAGHPTQQATSSGPGWASITTGVWVDKHGVDSNGAFSSGDFTSYPHFFSHVRAAHPSAHLASIVQWHPINQNLLQPFPGQASFTAQVANLGTAVRDAAIAQLVNEDPEVLFLHFDDVDHAGHGFGFATHVPQYITAIEETDTHIGSVLGTIASRPNAANEDWLILVTTDHGGNGTSHGGQSVGERTIFMVASGGEAIHETFSPGPGHTVIPTTVLRHLGIAVNPAWGWVDDQPFGFRQPHATVPSPSVGEIGTPQELTLDWIGGEDAISHDVFLSLSPVFGPGDLVGSTTTSQLSVDSLLEEQTYFWRVDTVGPSGTVVGDLWNFQTGGNLFNGIVAHHSMESDGINAVGVAPDGLIVGGPGFVPGQQGLALQVDQVGEYMSLGTPTDLDFGSSTDFTVGLWVRANGWSQDPVLIANKDWASGANVGWLLAADPDGVSWQWNLRGTSGARVDFDGIAPVADGTWHHICVVHDRDGVASFYTDGQLNGTRSIAGQGSVTSGLPTAIGQDGTLIYSPNTVADLDEVHIWRRALGPSEVQDLAAGLDASVGQRYCDGFPNTVSNGGRIMALGSDVIADNDLRLFALQLPVHQPGIFLYGPDAISIPIAGGVLCVSGPFYRIHPGTFSGLGGVIEQRMDLNANPFTGILQAGLTHHFQLWYRDPASTISNSNFTDALSIQF